ncbi:hypothetical protein C8J57DRAFT_1532419 [Mycena rebaudengoi]|nr:hypothetical protein C8J57DRAFT_1532419 [Mycena rebaudengoi]
MYQSLLLLPGARSTILRRHRERIVHARQRHRRRLLRLAPLLLPLLALRSLLLFFTGAGAATGGDGTGSTQSSSTSSPLSFSRPASTSSKPSPYRIREYLLC